MKKLIITTIALFALTATQAQTTFAFDSTNATFMHVTTDTVSGVVTIVMKTRDKPDERILRCKDGILDYLFGLDGEVTAPDGTVHPALVGEATGMELKINKVALIGKNKVKVELQYPVKYLDSLRDLNRYPDDKLNSKFKLERLEMK